MRLSHYRKAAEIMDNARSSPWGLSPDGLKQLRKECKHLTPDIRTRNFPEEEIPRLQRKHTLETARHILRLAREDMRGLSPSRRQEFGRWLTHASASLAEVETDENELESLLRRHHRFYAANELERFRADPRARESWLGHLREHLRQACATLEEFGSSEDEIVRCLQGAYRIRAEEHIRMMQQFTFWNTAGVREELREYLQRAGATPEEIAQQLASFIPSATSEQG